MVVDRKRCREKSDPKRDGGKGKNENNRKDGTGQTLRHQPAGAASLFQALHVFTRFYMFLYVFTCVYMFLHICTCFIM